MRSEHDIYFAEGHSQREETVMKELFTASPDADVFWCHAEIKAAEGEGAERVIEGYANTRNLDRMNEIVEPGAFKSSLKNWLERGIILLNHDTDRPLGRPKAAEIDDSGLKIKAELAQGIDYADTAWSLIKQRVLRAFSIGYRVLKDKVEDTTGDGGGKTGGRIRRILDLELFEVSVVSIPANRESLFSVTKALQFGTDLFRPDIQKIESAPDTEDVTQFVRDLVRDSKMETAVARLDAINRKLRRLP